MAIISRLFERVMQLNEDGVDITKKQSVANLLQQIWDNRNGLKAPHKVSYKGTEYLATPEEARLLACDPSLKKDDYLSGFTALFEKYGIDTKWSKDFLLRIKNWAGPANKTYKISELAWSADQKASNNGSYDAANNIKVQRKY